MIRTLLIFFFLVCVFLRQAYSDIIDVKIFAEIYLKEVAVTVISGNYELISGNKKLADLSKNNTIVITAEGKKISVKADSNSFTGLGDLKMVSKCNNGVFRIKPIGKPKARNYDDNFTITAGGGSLKIINNIDIEKYVPGVVEAEAGMMKSIEFYKVQSIACRTYVLRNIRRHSDEGFNVCDKVHCQVYNGKSYNEDILKAAEQTKHFVIIDKELNFISAVFHSNCGGQTVNSENVWTLPSTYLKSIKDTFCLKSRNAVWEFKISKENFLNYLKKNYNFPVEDSQMVKQAFNFSQLNGRRVYFLDLPLIHLKNLRKDLGLKSTFFTIYEESEMLIFKGRGFGHGVGLCQEGAMQMINDGCSYEDIIKHYYTNVYIVSYEDIIKLKSTTP